MRPSTLPAVRHAHFATFARLHRAGPDDLAELRAFSAGFDRDPLSLDWPATLTDTSWAVYLACEGGVLSGAVAGYCDPARVTADLCWVGVAPSARRRGIGRLLLEHLADAMRERGVADIAAGTDDPALTALMLAAGARLRGTRMHLPVLRQNDPAVAASERARSHG